MSRSHRDNHLLVLLAVVGLTFVVMSLARPGVFLSANNFRSMAFQFPEFAFLSLAVMITMLTGGIDLSVVSTALLSAILGALLLHSTADPQELSSSWVILAVLVTLAAGLFCGLCNGLLVSRLGISPILATLGTMQLFGGLAVVFTGGTAIYGFPDAYLHLGNGSLFYIPVPLLIFLFFAIMVTVILNRTPLGLKIYLTGGNPVAAGFAGIEKQRVLTSAYVLSGFLSSVAGLIMVARTNSANADYGASYLLLAILIAILGGVHPAGGFGKISGLVLAVLSLQLLSSGLNMLRFSTFARDLVWGSLLLLIMVLRPAIRNWTGLKFWKGLRSGG